MQWISIEHARSRHMGDTLALLRLGSHCALLDGVTARPVAVYERGIHTNRLPHVPPTATFDELGRALDSPEYYKIRLSPDRIRDFAPLRLDQLARHLSLGPASSDPCRENTWSSGCRARTPPARSRDCGTGGAG